MKTTELLKLDTKSPNTEVMKESLEKLFKSLDKNLIEYKLIYFAYFHREELIQR